jgi:hypothetical protein
MPYHPSPRRISPPGAMEGEGWIAEDFDDPLDALFDGLSDGSP